jgi:hypothetical protein
MTCFAFDVVLLDSRPRLFWQASLTEGTLPWDPTLVTVKRNGKIRYTTATDPKRLFLDRAAGAAGIADHSR